jgi:hypothetical protein
VGEGGGSGGAVSMCWAGTNEGGVGKGGGGADNKVVGPYWWGCHKLQIIHVEPQATHLHVQQGV